MSLESLCGFNRRTLKKNNNLKKGYKQAKTNQKVNMYNYYNFLQIKTS